MNPPSFLFLGILVFMISWAVKYPSMFRASTCHLDTACNDTETPKHNNKKIKRRLKWESYQETLSRAMVIDRFRDILKLIEYTKVANTGFDELMQICEKFQSIILKEHLTMNEITTLEDLQKDAEYVFHSLLHETSPTSEHREIIDNARDRLLDAMYDILSSHLRAPFLSTAT
jgi:hypothetical protein